MYKVLVVSMFIAMLPLQATAARDKKEKVVFEGLIGFVVDREANTDQHPEVRAVLVNAMQTKAKPKHKRKHNGWLIVREKDIVSYKNTSVPHDCGGNVWALSGSELWCLNGYEVTFAVSDDDKITFDESNVASLEELEPGKGYGPVMPGVWDGKPLVVGGRVRLKGGTLEGGSSHVKCKFENNTEDCKEPSCDEKGGLARSLKYTAKFDTIRAYALGSDPATATPALEIKLKDGAKIRIVNAPFWTIKGPSHFREFYDLSLKGTGVVWENRCNVEDLTPLDSAETPGLLMDKLVFCPPAVLNAK